MLKILMLSLVAALSFTTAANAQEAAPCERKGDSCVINAGLVKIHVKRLDTAEYDITGLDATNMKIAAEKAVNGTVLILNEAGQLVAYMVTGIETSAQYLNENVGRPWCTTTVCDVPMGVGQLNIGNVTFKRQPNGGDWDIEKVDFVPVIDRTFLAIGRATQKTFEALRKFGKGVVNFFGSKKLCKYREPNGSIAYDFCENVQDGQSNRHPKFISSDDSL